MPFTNKQKARSFPVVSRDACRLKGRGDATINKRTYMTELGKLEAGLDRYDGPEVEALRERDVVRSRQHLSRRRSRMED